MTPKVRDLLELLEEVAPARLAEPWDNPGLQVGANTQEVRKVLFALDASLEAVRRCMEIGAQALITHHPLVLRPLSNLNVALYPGNAIREALRGDISVIAVHTNLDVAQGGINDILAELLGLTQTEKLQDMEEGDGTGLGRIGELQEPMKLSDLEDRVARAVGAARVRAVGRSDMVVTRVAVVGGSGGGLVSVALEKHAQVLVTGDVTHHQALEAQSLGVAVIDGGHFNTEKTAFGIFAKNLAHMIRSRGLDIDTETDEEEANPIRESKP